MNPLQAVNDSYGSATSDWWLLDWNRGRGELQLWLGVPIHSFWNCGKRDNWLRAERKPLTMADNTKMPSPHRFGGLDALRGVAAIAVFGMHIRWFFSPQYGFPGAYLAVDLFFLLSGFVVAYAYDARLSAGMTPGTFLKRRMIRFLPLLWLGVTIGAGALAWKLTHSVVNYTKRDIVLAVLHNALLLPTNFGPASLLFPTNWPEWSLFLELVANAAYAVLYRHLTTRRLAVFTGLSLIPLMATAIHFHGLDAGVLIQHVFGGLARVAFAFPAGLLLYRTREHWQKLHRLPRVSIWWLAVILTLVLLLPIATAWRSAFDFASVVLLWPLLVACGSQSPAATGRSAQATAWLGLISYPVYAVHGPVIGWLSIGMGEHPRFWSWQAIAVILAVIACAAWLERNYHRRVANWISRFLARTSEIGKPLVLNDVAHG